MQKPELPKEGLLYLPQGKTLHQRYRQKDTVRIFSNSTYQGIQIEFQIISL